VSALQRLLRKPSFGLLLSLAALILLEPSAERLRGGVPALAALHLGVLGLAVRLVGSTRGERRVTWLLAAPTIALNLGSLLAHEPVLVLANHAMSVVFYGHVIRCLIAYVLRDTVVTLDELFAAACIYVLMAMWFACVYTILESRAPGSFSLPPPPVSDITRYWDLVYFSFTVLTSTGFGDIHPLARQARAFVIVEQVAGVMYVAILIARLTGMTPIRRSSQSE
jgi:hypothetical protein